MSASQTKSAAISTSDDECSLTKDSAYNIISIPKTSEYLRNKDQGCQAAIIRSVRAAGVKFLRYSVVDASQMESDARWCHSLTQSH